MSFKSFVVEEAFLEDWVDFRQQTGLGECFIQGVRQVFSDYSPKDRSPLHV